MKVYKLEPDVDRKYVRFAALNDVVLGEHLPSHPVIASGGKIRIGRNNESTPIGSSARLGDFSNVNYMSYPCFSANAKSLLGPHLEGLGQWYELDSEEAPYWLFNITNIVDALDEKLSSVERFSNGRVMFVNEFVMKPDVVRNQLIFMIPQRPGTYNLVTDRFVDLVNQHRLTGFVFKPLWSLEGGAVKPVRFA